jgi:hypothetical protein
MWKIPYFQNKVSSWFFFQVHPKKGLKFSLHTIFPKQKFAAMSANPQEKKEKEEVENNKALEAIRSLSLDKKTKKILEEDPSRAHPFWDSQPVPKLGPKWINFLHIQFSLQERRSTLRKNQDRLSRFGQLQKLNKILIIYHLASNGA